MSVPPRVHIHLASIEDDDGLIRCPEHGLVARRLYSSSCAWPTEGACKHTLHCVYFVCPKKWDDPDRCDFFWWANPDTIVDLPPSHIPTPELEDMVNSSPSQAQRAAAARAKSTPSSPQKRARSVTPPYTNPQGPTTPSQKRMAAILEGLSKTQEDSPSQPGSPSKRIHLTPAQRKKRLENISKGLFVQPSFSRQQAPEPQTPTSASRGRSMVGAFAPAMDVDEDDGTPFTSSQDPLPNIQNALHSVHEGRTPTSRTISGAATNGASQSAGNGAHGGPADDEEANFWSSPSKNDQRTPRAGPSNTRTGVTAGAGDPRSEQDAPRTPMHHGMLTPPESVPQRISADIDALSQASAAQVASMLVPDADDEDFDEPAGDAVPATSNGKEREGPRPRKSWSRVQSDSQENPFLGHERPGPSRVHFFDDPPETGAEALDEAAEVLINTAGKLKVVAQYMGDLEREKDANCVTLDEKTQYIRELEERVRSLEDRVDILEREREERE